MSLRTSSTIVLTFAIFPLQTSAGKAIKNFKETKEQSDVIMALRLFLEENPNVKVCVWGCEQWLVSVVMVSYVLLSR